jgi:hypothetical protein
VTTVADVGTELVDALRRRDYLAVAGCFAQDAHMRSIVPPGVREDAGADAIAARFRLWTESLTDYELVDSSVAPLADLLRLSWALRGVDPDIGPCLFEQTAYAELDDGRITRMRVACSGKRPLG